MAGRRIGTLPYDDWIGHVFSHEVRVRGLPWYFDLDADRWDGSARETVEHLTRLFEDPEPALLYFADTQIDQGLRYLIDSGAGGLTLSIGAEEVPLADGLRCVRAIHTLFARIFDLRCGPRLSHLDEPGVGPLNGICYMWWDIYVAAPLAAGSGRDAMLEAEIWTLTRTLKLGSPACQEAALHGLGHRARYAPEAVTAVIDAYLAGQPPGRQSAAQARSGRLRQGGPLRLHPMKQDDRGRFRRAQAKRSEGHTGNDPLAPGAQARPALPGHGVQRLARGPRAAGREPAPRPARPRDPLPRRLSAPDRGRHMALAYEQWTLGQQIGPGLTSIIPILHHPFARERRARALDRT